MNAAPSTPHLFRNISVWGLVFALAVYGYSGVLVQVLGSLHRHAEPAAAMSASVDADEEPSLLSHLVSEVQAWHEAAQARRHALLPHTQAHAHHHGLFERHHHDADDSTVVALGEQASSNPGADDLGSSATPGAGLLPIGPLPSLQVPAPAQGRLPWPGSTAAGWRSAELKRAERPPHA